MTGSAWSGVNGSGKTTLLRLMADALPLRPAPEEHPAAIGLHAWGRIDPRQHRASSAT